MRLITRSRGLPGPASCGSLLALSCFAFVAGGCAHTPDSQYQYSSYAGGPRAQAAAAAPVEMEDDGRPAQVAPRMAAAPAKDDPSEPWSPNYGGPANERYRPRNTDAKDAAAAPPAQQRPQPQRVAAAHDDD